MNDIVENFVQRDKSQDDPFWDNSAGNLFRGLILLLFKYCKDYGLGKEYVRIENVVQLRNILFTEGKNRIKQRVWEYVTTDFIIESALIGTYGAPHDTKNSILSVFDSKIQMFLMHPALLDMLSKNDFNFDDIGQKRVAIFLIIPDEKTGYHGLVALFIKQSYEYLIYKAQIEAGEDGIRTGRLPNRINYILDEFSSLPVIKDFPAMMAASRSRNIRFTLILQSQSQLVQRYKEEAETIQANCNNWIFLMSREVKFLEEISKLCGKTSTEPIEPILSIRSLQRLNRDEGEILLLCDRMKPCIAKLPDIDLYDIGQFDKKCLIKREMNKGGILNFKDLYSTEYIEQKRDEIIRKIDDEIAELEKELEESKKRRDKRDNREELK